MNLNMESKAPKKESNNSIPDTPSAFDLPSRLKTQSKKDITGSGKLPIRPNNSKIQQEGKAKPAASASEQ